MAASVEKLQAIGNHAVVATLRLDEQQPVHFLAGQGVSLRLRDGCDHTLNVASAPQALGADRIELHLWPSAWRDKLSIGTRVDVQVLRGGFHWQADVHKPAVLVAQGDDVAPLWSIAQHALRTGWPRPLHFYWGAGSDAAVALRSEAQAWAAAHDNFYFTCIDGEPGNEPGRALDAVAQDFPDLSPYQLYVHAQRRTIDEARSRFVNSGGVDPLHFHASESPQLEPHLFSPRLSSVGRP